MTVLTEIKTKKRKNSICTFIISIVFTAIILSAALFLSEEISELVTMGLEICVKTIIPSVFPFLIITDILIRFIKFEKNDFLRRGFERIFKINGAALSVFICGILSGFPTGAKLSLTLYYNGKISKDECERLMGISSNASPGYIICAVGSGMLGNLRLGALLFFITAISSVFSGFVLGINSKSTINSSVEMGQKYSFSNSVKSAALACLNICAFVTFFSLVSGLLKLYANRRLLLFIFPFLEIATATAYITELCILPPAIRFSLIAFSISFSGICVYAQIKSLITDD